MQLKEVKEAVREIIDKEDTKEGLLEALKDSICFVKTNLKVSDL